MVNCGAVILEGCLCSGLGEGAGFTTLDWVTRQIQSKLGFAPHPGTLNLSLAGADWEAARAEMEQEPGIAIEPPTGFCAAKCFTLIIDGRIQGAAVIPEMPDYPADKLEIIAPVSVRDALRLSDGDRITLQILIA